MTNGHARSNQTLGWVATAAIAVVGLTLVKWLPYYHKALLASTRHSIGGSILMGAANRPPPPSMQAALDYALAYGQAIWKAMVLGLLLGSAAQTLMPRRWVWSIFGRSGLVGAALGGIAALPTMMCTCCAAPVVAGLRECRASSSAAIAFWLGNTLLNPATLVFTGFVLGWDWSILRLTFGVLMVFGLGSLVERLDSSSAGVRQGAEAPADIGGQAAPTQQASFGRWLIVLGRMSVRLVPEYAALVLALGALRAWLFPQIGPEIDNSLPWVATFAVMGALFVIPTAGEVPIVQAMLLLGVGAGPAAALLMTLPPISVPSIAMLWRSFRPRTLMAVSLGVVLLGGAAGLVAQRLLH
jgi:uncharacterized membrane protein YraQ (UPF0718 family)